MTPEALARGQIDHLLTQTGWHVCNIDQVNLHAAQDVAIREFPLNVLREGKTGIIVFLKQRDDLPLFLVPKHCGSTTSSQVPKLQ